MIWVVSLLIWLLVSVALHHWWRAFNCKVQRIRRTLPVIWYRTWLRPVEIWGALRLHGQPIGFALDYCLWQMRMEGVIEYNPETDMYRLKAHEWT